MNDLPLTLLLVFAAAICLLGVIAVVVIAVDIRNAGKLEDARPRNTEGGRTRHGAERFRP